MIFHLHLDWTLNSSLKYSVQTFIRFCHFPHFNPPRLGNKLVLVCDVFLIFIKAIRNLRPSFSLESFYHLMSGLLSKDTEY